MQLNVQLLHPAAQLPTYGTDGAACFDLYAIVDGEAVTVGPDRPVTLRTGLAFEIPQGWCLLVFSRSGHGFKHGIRLANTTGVIDADYRGELMVRLCADYDEQAAGLNRNHLVVRTGDRIAQGMLVPAVKVQSVAVQELGETTRGSGGFGSTGA